LITAGTTTSARKPVAPVTRTNTKTQSAITTRTFTREAFTFLTAYAGVGPTFPAGIADKTITAWFITETTAFTIIFTITAPSAGFITVFETFATITTHLKTVYTTRTTVTDTAVFIAAGFTVTTIIITFTISITPLNAVATVRTAFFKCTETAFSAFAVFIVDTRYKKGNFYSFNYIVSENTRECETYTITTVNSADP